MQTGGTAGDREGSAGGGGRDPGGVCVARPGVAIAVILATLVVAALALSLAGAAQSDSRLRGEVTYQSGTPGADIDVEIVNTDSNTVVDTVTTDSNGAFGPDQYPPANYTARVDRPGVEAFATTVHLETGETEKIDVVLENVTGIVSAEVTDTNNNPAADVEVEFVMTDRGTVEATRTTASDGSTGPAEVSANANYTAAVDVPGKKPFATRVSLDADESATIFVTLEAITGTLEGEVTDPNGDPVAGVEVLLFNVDLQRSETTVTTRSDGTYGPVEVPADANYTAQIDDGQWKGFAAQLRVAENETERLDVDVQRKTGDLTVTATDEDGTRIENVTVEIVDNDTGTVVASGRTATDGTTDAVSLTAGNYTARITTDGWQSSAETVQLRYERSATIALTGSLADASLEGEVTDGSGGGVADATVTITNTSAGSRVRTVRTDENGQWGPVSVAAGAYEVGATADGFRDTATEVTVAPGATGTVSLPLARAAPLRITSTDTSITDGTLTVTITVRNDGDAPTTESVTLSVDGTERAERTVAVDGGTARTLTLETTLSADAESYSITVAAGTETTTSTVAAPAGPTATPTGTPTATRTDGDGAGLGLLVAVVALGSAGLGVSRRRD